MLELCSVASGSSGNCICVGNDNTHILVDAGVSGKRIEMGLNAFDLTTSDIEGILITHEHTDHIAALGVLARRYGIPMYTTAGTKEAILHTKSLGQIDSELIKEIHPDEEFVIGELRVQPMSISHDAADPVAYRIHSGENSVAVITDLGTYDQSLVEKLQGLNGLLLEANHDVKMLQMGSYPYQLKKRILGDSGHLSNERSGQLLCQLLNDHMEGIMLGHLSLENNYEQLAYEAVRLEITMGENPYKAEDFHISVARRDVASPRIRIES